MSNKTHLRNIESFLIQGNILPAEKDFIKSMVEKVDFHKDKKQAEIVYLGYLGFIRNRNCLATRYSYNEDLREEMELLYGKFNSLQWNDIK